MNEKIISIAVSTGLMSLIFWLFSKYYPVKKSKYQSTKPIGELRKEFWKFDILILILFFVLTPIFVIITYILFGWISDLRFSKASANGYLFIPERMMWFVPAIFAGLGLSAFVFLKLQKPILKDRFNDYAAYSSLKYGFDADRVSNFLIKFLIVFVTAFFILAINYYAYFGNDKIMISDFFQLTESKYEYNDITAIKSVDKLIAPNGNVVIDKHYVIDFSDSYKWSSRQGGDSNYEKDTDMINYILTKTGLEIKHLEFDK
jgi:multisubunit Na+/H+ antiporter MnhB subunit